MNEDKRPNNSAVHIRMARGYLVGSLLSLVVTAIAFMPATPLFIKLLLPFPRLEDASHWAGQIEVEGQYAVGAQSNTVPRNFIVTPSGRHEFQCGYFGFRIPCSNYQLLDGATGEVWYHPIFGALQWRFAISQERFKGQVEERSIAAREASFREDFFYSRYIKRLLVALTALVVTLWQYTRYLHHRAAASASDKAVRKFVALRRRRPNRDTPD